MKKFLLICSTLFITLAAATQSPIILKYIPANAKMVAGFNPVRLAGKVPGETFRQSKVYEQVVGKNEEIKKFFQDPAVTGINFNANIWIVANQDEENANGGLVNIYGVLKDEPAFAKLIQQINKDEEDIKRFGTNRLMIPPHGGMALAWNDEIFVVALPNKNRDRSIDIDEETDTVAVVAEDDAILVDTIATIDYEKQWMAEQEAKYKAMRDRCFDLLTPKNEKGISANKSFMLAMSSDADIRLWSDGSPNAAFRKMNPLEKEFAQLTRLTGQNKSTMINFENGKISVRTRSFLDAEIAALYAKYPQAPIPLDLIKKLPQGTILGLVSASFNADLAKEMMKLSGLNKFRDSILKVMPFADKITEAFKENMLMAVLKSNNPNAGTGKLKGIDIIIAAPVGNKSKLEEIRTQVKELLAKESANGKTEKILKDIKPVVRFNDHYFVLASSEAAAQAYLNNPGITPVPEWIQQYQQLPMVANINLRQILNLVFAKEGGKSEAKMAEMKKMVDIFDQITFTGAHYADNSLNGSGEFTFTNKEDNAILQIFKLINATFKEGRGKMDAEMGKE